MLPNKRSLAEKHINQASGPQSYIWPSDTTISERKVHDASNVVVVILDLILVGNRWKGESLVGDWVSA